VISLVAEHDVNHGQALEVVPDVHLFGHAHAAVQLHAALADHLAVLADEMLGRGYRLAAKSRIVLVEAHGRHVGHGSRFLAGDEHVHELVRKHLELADGPAELLARVEVFIGAFDHHIHRAHRFRAQRRDGDDYVINGRKIWTSGAESSDYCWLAARTDPESSRHAGISMFVVPMKQPGIEIRPIVNLLEKHWFNEVVFEDVRVSVADRIGGEGEGWGLLGSALGVERITIYRAYVHWRTLVGAVRRAKANGGEGWSRRVRQQIGGLRVEYEIAELLLERAVQMHTEGRDYRGQAAMVKLFNTEFAQRLYETSLNLLGLYGPLTENDPRAPYEGATSHNFLSAVQDTIGAGTSEVQRDLIAIRALGLPRG